MILSKRDRLTLRHLSLNLRFALIYLLFISLPIGAENQPAPNKPLGLNVYPAIPGIEASTSFSSRVFDGRQWSDLFTMETVGPKQEECGRMGCIVRGNRFAH